MSMSYKPSQWAVKKQCAVGHWERISSLVKGCIKRNSFPFGNCNIKLWCLELQQPPCDYEERHCWHCGSVKEWNLLRNLVTLLSYWTKPRTGLLPVTDLVEIIHVHIFYATISKVLCWYKGKLNDIIHLQPVWINWLYDKNNLISLFLRSS